MLTQEEADKHIKELKKSDWRKLAAGRLDKRPAKDRDAGRTLVGLTKPKSLNAWAERERMMREAAAYLDGLSAARRTEVFAAAFPKLAPHIERAWQQLKLRPYSVGWHSLPFRAPSNPEATLSHRGSWLQQLVNHLEGLDVDAVWLAQYAPYVAPYYGGEVLGTLLAAAIDGEGDQADEVMQILIDSANGDHEVGAMGRHVTQALLCCSRPEAWDYVEKLLLAAQRQEGLRQVILESVDAAHPEAYLRMLRLLLEHDMQRFASVARAVDVWFAMQWDSASTKVIKTSMERALTFLTDDAARAKAIQGGEAEDAYMALWAEAYRDAFKAVPLAKKLLKHDKVEMRFTGAWTLSLLSLDESRNALFEAIDDKDPRVAALAVNALPNHSSVEDDNVPAALRGKLFKQLDSLRQSLPKKSKAGKPLLWPWLTFSLEKHEAADAMIECVPKDGWPTLFAAIPDMSADGRHHLLCALKKCKPLPEPSRQALLQLAGDASPRVREDAIALIGRSKLDADEAEQMETLFKRKASDLRRALLTLMLKQDDTAALASVDRLLASKTASQRAGGVELLAKLFEKDRQVKPCRERATAYQELRGDKLSVSEQGLLAPILGVIEEKPKLTDALGLMNAENLTPSKPVKDRKADLITQAAVNIIAALDDLIHVHREAEVEIQNYDGSISKELVGNAHALRRGHFEDKDRPMPMADVWLEWWENRPKSCRDKDGFEAVRADALTSFFGWRGTFNIDPQAAFGKKLKVDAVKNLRYLGVVRDVTNFLAHHSEPEGLTEFLLDAAETGLSRLPEKFFSRHLRGDTPNASAFGMARAHYVTKTKDWSDDQVRRLVELARWRDIPIDSKGNKLFKLESLEEYKQRVAKEEASGRYYGHNRIQERARLDAVLLAPAVRLKVVNDDDVYENLLASRGLMDRSLNSGEFVTLRELTKRKPPAEAKDSPRLLELVNRARQRVLDVELTRGDEPTAATGAAFALSSVPGVEALVRALKALGKQSFMRGYVGYYGDSGRDKKTVFSSLIRCGYPLASDTAETLKRLADEAGISEQRLVDTALFAPQWASLIGEVLGWPGFTDGVWWLHAHTKDDQWSVDQEVREQWEREISERTPLSGADLVDGAVDVAWFNRTYGQLKKKRWESVYAAAKNASSGGGHKRAQLFADAMLGNVTKTELTKRIKDKRDKEAMRAIGLLPLAGGNRRKKDLLSRYELLQEVIRTSKQFGNMRQTSEKRAVEIGQANLARTAGYPDPLRLQWAMEASAIADLAAGPVSVTVGPTTVSLSVDDAGDPQIGVVKNDKTLKSVPAAAAKDKKVKALKARRTALRRQASRMRKSLEQMMCRRDELTGEELGDLMQHAIMRPMLERLVFIGEGIAGYPAAAGKVLVNHAGKKEPVKKTETLRLAHPNDLITRGDWSDWQRDCYQAERVQPFKQLFRELYVLTDAERTGDHASARYAGQQVNPRQALALLSGRGWVSLPEEGVRKTFHDLGLSAWLEFQEGFYTPAEIDGLTLEHVRFSKAGEWKAISLEDVPATIFSEVMRDLDLVVSVAHRGGVDPEASASTVEMRTDLLRETLAMLSIENVRLEKSHALIRGDLAEYTVHLGSAVLHMQPGGSLFLIPVHSQHRGRLFLPFADDDPKTAEVISKVLLLARDKQIKDPKVLEQIRAR